MPGPWEEYQTSSGGPWDEYADGNPVAAPAPVAAPKPDPWYSWRPKNPVNELQTGAAKGIGSTLWGATELVNKGIRLIPGAKEYVPLMPEKPAAMKPEGTMQNIGYGAEQIGEFFVPGGLVLKGSKLLKGGKVIKGVGAAALEALSAGGVSSAQTGDIEEGAKAGLFAGGVAGGMQALAPVVNRVGRALVPRLRDAWNAVERPAIDFAGQLGIPLSMGQRAGSEMLQRAEKGLVNVPGASGTAQKFFDQQKEEIAGAGKRLFNRASPAGAKETVEAGQSVADRLLYKITQAKQFADKRYGQVRSTVGQARNRSTVQVGETVSPIVDEFGGEIVRPVLKTFETATDIGKAQSELRGIVDELAQTMPEFQRQSSPGFTALKQIVDGPEVVDALTADRNLSAVKALLRESGGASKYLSSKSKRLAAITVDALTKSFDDALGKAGGDALLKLNQGRKAVVRYHDVAELLSSLPKNAAGELEPVGVYSRLTSGGDRNIRLLEEIHKMAPKETAELGHTFLTGMLDKATAEGGFGRATGVVADWNRLGPNTKRILFGDSFKTSQIDKFLLAAKRLTVDVNPSGTAKLLTAIGPAGIALSALLNPATAASMAGGAYASKKAAELLLTKGGAPLMRQLITLNPNTLTWINSRAALNAMYAKMIAEEQ